MKSIRSQQGNQAARKTVYFGVSLAVAVAVMGLNGLARAAESKLVQVSVGEAVTLSAENVSTLAVADPTVADVTVLSDTEINVIGKRPGVTTLTVVHKEGKATEQYRLEVSNSLALRTIREVTGCPTILVRELGDAVVLDGKVETELQAERAVKVAAAYRPNVVNLLQVTSPRQVRIRTRLVEVQTDAIKNLGVQYFGANGEVVYGFGRVSTTEGGAADYSGHGFLDPLQTVGQTLSPGSIPIAVQAQLQALAQKNEARILAQPTLVTLSGKEASFLSGGEVPIVQQLAQTFTVEFKQFGILMKIKPTVDADNHIATHVMTEVSDVNASVTVAGVPSFNTRRAETDLQLADGQTLVIGGLLNNQHVTDALRKIPWLGDIPVLGVLFRSKNFQASKSELLVFVTPEIVKNIEMETANAAKTPDMKEWNGVEAERQLMAPTKPSPNWQKPLDVDEFGWTKPEPPPPVKPARLAKPGTPAPASESNSNFTPARPAGGS